MGRKKKKSPWTEIDGILYDRSEAQSIILRRSPKLAAYHASPEAARKRGRAISEGIRRNNSSERIRTKLKVFYANDKNRSEILTRFHLDHDHLTGFTRGVLCFWCNTNTVKGDTISWFKAKLAYLEFHRDNPNTFQWSQATKRQRTEYRLQLLNAQNNRCAICDRQKEQAA